VFNVPDGTMPIDHTSILRTVEKRWGLPSLTARDAAAPDLGAVLTLSTPRTDDPLKGVKPPKASGKDPAKGKPSHLQKIHAELVANLPLRDRTGDHAHKTLNLRTSRDYDRYIEKRTEAWKASCAAAKKKPPETKKSKR